MLQLQPIDYAEACSFIAQYHRHHLRPQGWKFGLAANDGERVVGVVTVGRPVARLLDNGITLEVTRLCTDGTKNVCSMLYSAAWRAARSLGYKRLITYILASESGTSLRAAGWRIVGQCGGGSWCRSNRFRVNRHPTGEKTLWEQAI
ncbi:MAG: XF1762 family protein [Thermodesulfobacteriota bacterium]